MISRLFLRSKKILLSARQLHHDFSGFGLTSKNPVMSTQQKQKQEVTAPQAYSGIPAARGSSADLKVQRVSRSSEQ